MNRILASITTIEQHREEVANGGHAYKPSNCPTCSNLKLWGHGCYHRKKVRGMGANQSIEQEEIPRFRCTSCKHTCSCLPACIPPRRWYDWTVQQFVLLLVLTGVSLHQCWRRCGGPARSTLRRWRDWLFNRGDEFAFHLRSREPEFGRVSEPSAFWHNVISSLSLAQAMALLDRHLIVP